MNPIAIYLEYSFINFFRHVRRRVSKEPVLAAGALVALVFCGIFVLESFAQWGDALSQIAPYAIAGYGVYKILQGPPALSMRACLISFEIFSFKQFKIICAIRFLVPTAAFVSVCFFAGIDLTSQFVGSCLFNITANVISVAKYSLKSGLERFCFMSAGLVLGVTGVALSFPALPVISFFVSTIVFLRLSFFSYDDWYPYCLDQQLLHDALIEGNRELISLSQQAFFKNSRKRFLRVKGRGYDFLFYERIALSRLCDHWKGFIACMFVAFGASIMYFSVPWFGGMARVALVGAVVMGADAFLTALNAVDRDAASMNPLFGRSFSQELRRGYVVQFLATAITVLCGSALFPAVSIPFLLPFCLLLPIQNMYVVEARSAMEKCIGYAFKAFVISLPLGMFLFPAVASL